MTTLAAADKLIDQWESGGSAEPVKTAPKGSVLSAADSLIQDWESGKDVSRETARPRVSPAPARPALASDLTAVYLNKGAAQFGQMSDTAADTQRKADIPIAEMMQKLIGDPARRAALDGAKEAPDIRQEIAKRYPGTNPETVQAEMNKAFTGYQMAARTLASEHEVRGVDARRANARFLARNTTPDMVPYVAHALNELYAEKGPNRNRKLSGQVWDTFSGAMREAKNLPQDIVHMATDEEGVAERTQQYLAAMESADPVAGKDAGALRKGFLAAIGMIPMAATAEAVGGMVAAKVGRYGLAGRAAGSGTVAAIWSAPSVKDSYEQMVSAGVSEGKAKTGSLFSGVIQAAIETLAIDAVIPAPLRGIVKGKLKGVLAKGVTNRVLALGKELMEEGGQSFVQQMGTEIQDDVDATTKDAFVRSTKAAIEGAKAAIIPILFLGAPGTVATFKNAKADTELNEFRKWMAGQQETAGYIVQANPDLAAKILGAENPSSRAAIKGASPALAESLEDKASREAFVANLAKTPEGKVAEIEAEYAHKFKNPKTRERRLEADPAYKQAQQELSDYYAKLHEARQEFGGDVAASQETAKIKAVKEKFTQAGGPAWSPRPGEDVGVKIDTGLVKEAANAQEGGIQTQEAGKETGAVQGAGGGVRVRNNVQDGAQAQAQALQAVGTGAPGPISVGTMLSTARKGGSMLKSFFKQYGTTAGNMPKVAWNANLKRVGKLNELMTNIKNTRHDFKKAIKATYGTKNVDAPTHAIINGSLAGDPAAYAVLPAGMKDIVGRMRVQVDAMSQQLIDSGAIEGPLLETVEANKEMYLNRSYKAFTDKRWAKSAEAQRARNLAQASIEQDFPDLNPQEVQGLLDNLLEVGKAGDTLVHALGSGKLGAKEIGVLMRRSGIPPAIRDFLGENKNAYVNYANSASKIGHLVASHEMLSAVRAAGEGVFLFLRPTTNQGGKFIYPLAGKDSKTYSPLNGMYTTKEIAESLQKNLDPKNLPGWFRWYMKGLFAAKAAKTVGSVQSQVRNFLSNPVIAIANGNWRVGNVGKALMANLSSVNINNATEWRDYFKKLQRLNIVSDSAHAADMRNMLRDAMTEDPDSFILKYGFSPVRATINAATEAYRIGDDFWKVYNFENEKAKYRQTFPTWSEDQLDENARAIVRNTVPTASMVPEAIRQLRKFPLVGAFPTFAFEIYRTSGNLLAQISKELKDPRTRGIGMGRAIGTMTAATVMGGGVSAAFRYLFGITPERDKDVRRFVAPWSKNSDLVHLGKKDGPAYEIVDLSYSDPYSYIKNPLTALLRGEDWKQGVEGMLQELLSPFLAEELLTKNVLDVLRNTTSDGRRIINPEADYDTKAAAWLAHLTEPLVPGTVTSLQRVGKGILGRTGTYGKSYDWKNELTAMLAGQRRTDVNIPQALGFKAWDFGKRGDNARDIFRKVASRRGTVSDGEILSSYLESDAALRKIFDEMHKDVVAAMRMGMSEREVIASMKDRGVAQKTAYALVSGAYTPYSPARDFLRTLGNEEYTRRWKAIRAAQQKVGGGTSRE